jgi:hypothetical protein
VGTAVLCADQIQSEGLEARQFGPRHSLGLGRYGSIETLEPTKWLLAYSGNVSKPLSVSVAIGSGFDAGPDLVTRTTVMWRLGAARRR